MTWWATEGTRSRAATAIILLMGAFALCTFASYVTAVRPSRSDQVGIKMDAERFRSLRESLPAREVVGYLSDVTAGMEGTRAYYLTQYYVAPVVVARDPAHELVIANFASPAAVAAAAAADDLTVWRNFSNGVALLRRGSP
jgi:hypothetical protein